MTWTVDEITDALGDPIECFAHQCHAAAITLVNSGLFDVARVARGSATGVPGQHSWVILASNVYDWEAQIVDVTLWSYDAKQPQVWVGTRMDDIHRPHGSGSVFQVGMPIAVTTEYVDLAGFEGLSRQAKVFLGMVGPLDLRGWAQVACGPMESWPSREIIEAMLNTPALAPLVPIDIAGMLTDRNPAGLYLPTKEWTSESAGYAEGGLRR